MSGANKENQHPAVAPTNVADSVGTVVGGSGGLPHVSKTKSHVSKPLGTDAVATLADSALSSETTKAPDQSRMSKEAQAAVTGSDGGVFETPNVASTKKQSRLRPRQMSSSEEDDYLAPSRRQKSHSTRTGGDTQTKETPVMGLRGQQRESFNALHDSKGAAEVPSKEARRKLSFVQGPTRSAHPPAASSASQATPRGRRVTRGSSNTLGDIEYNIATDIPLTERQQISFLSKQMETKTVSRKDSKRVNSRNERGETPLHRACIKGDLTEVESLIARGADINARDHAGWCPLHEASNHGFVGIVAVLIRAGGNIHAEGLDQDTPLHDAAVNDHFAIVKLLVEHGASPTKKNRRGKTAIEYATSAANKEIVDYFKTHIAKKAAADEARPQKRLSSVAPVAAKPVSGAGPEAPPPPVPSPAPVSNPAAKQGAKSRPANTTTRKANPPKRTGEGAVQIEQTRTDGPRKIAREAHTNTQTEEGKKELAVCSSAAKPSSTKHRAPLAALTPRVKAKVHDGVAGNDGNEGQSEPEKQILSTQTHEGAAAPDGQAAALPPKRLKRPRSMQQDTDAGRQPAVVAPAPVVWREAVLPGTEAFMSVNRTYKRNLAQTCVQDDGVAARSHHGRSPKELELIALDRRHRRELDRLQMTIEQQLINQRLRVENLEVQGLPGGRDDTNACQRLFNKRLAGHKVRQAPPLPSKDALVETFARLKRDLVERQRGEQQAILRTHQLLYP